MKMRSYVIAFHVILCLILIGVLHQLNHMEYTSVDIVDCNGRMKEIEKTLNEIDMFVETRKKVCRQIEERLACKIIFTDEEGYMSQLYEAYRNGDTIFDYMRDGNLAGKILFPRTDVSFSSAKKHMKQMVFWVIGLLIFVGDTLFFILYRRIYAPFWQLQRFASHIATGNFDIPLYRNKHNYFGAFTESFDIMREELKAAKEGEARASRSKKELVASLSHDIKTPVATIKALCEVLEIQVMEPEKVKKIHTIEQKADQIDQLISNMFHATLSELEALKIQVESISSLIMTQMFEDLNHDGKIKLESDIPSCLILCDPLRLTQVIDNIIGNSYKYAGTTIHITVWEEEQFLMVEIRDEGSDLEKVDVTMVCEKFYRGANAEHRNGSGLGLFLSYTFMEGMGGSLSCRIENGFVVRLALQKEGKGLAKN